jgi:hypothetical protein
MTRIALLAALVLAACHVEDAPERPIDDHVALCCKAAEDTPLSFTGCRPSNHCRASETVWLRGPVHCDPLEASRCAGGRCCSLAITPASPPETDEMIGQPIEAPAYTPEPAPIVPNPLESP